MNLDFFGRATRSAVPAAEGMPEAVRPPSRSEVISTVINPRLALTLDAVFRSVLIIQTAAAQLTLDAWRGSERLDGDAYPSVLSSPWEDSDQTDLITELVASLALRGNAYMRVIRNDRGTVVGLRPLAPLECVPRLAGGSGRRSVEWRGKIYGPEDIAHMRLLRVPGEAEGLGPIQACARGLNAATTLAAYSGDFLTNGGIPTGVLSTDQTITQQVAEDTKARWNERNSTRDGIAVLGSGLKFQALQLKPEDIQFLQSREFDDKSIARMFGIPAHLALIAMEGSSLTYQNIQDADLSFMRWTGMSYLRPIESAISRVLNGRQNVRFNLDAFLRPDTRSRYEAYQVGIDAGFINAQWVQDNEGLPRMAADERKNPHALP